MYGPILDGGKIRGVNAQNIIGHIFFWHYWGPAHSKGQGISAVMWTISLEVQFYAFYGIFYRSIRKIGLARAAAWAIGFEIFYRVAWVFWLNGLDLPLVFTPYRFAPARFGEWLLGAALAEQFFFGRLTMAPVRSILIGIGCFASGVFLGIVANIDKYTAMDIPACFGFYFILKGVLSLELSQKIHVGNFSPGLEKDVIRCI